MDASANDPRLYPTTFRNPRPGLLPGLERCDTLLARLHRHAATRQEFKRERQALYLELHSFAALLRALKQVTMRGESFTTLGRLEQLDRVSRRIFQQHLFAARATDQGIAEPHSGLLHRFDQRG